MVSLLRLRVFAKRFQLWLGLRSFGRPRSPYAHRRWLRGQELEWESWVRQHHGGAPWRTQVLRDAAVQPFVDLLNRASGGEAYCGGVLFEDPQHQPVLRHFRGCDAIDRPLTRLDLPLSSVVRCDVRLFWCGPLVAHFGHQIADFSSRALRASLDPRYGELLWIPWRSATEWEALLPWQRSLLTYLNPGGKRHRFVCEHLRVGKLVIVPQQARMRAAPTLVHLEALGWCERAITPHSNRLVYVSRSRFARCTSSDTLVGAFAAELLLEKLLEDRGALVVYPEMLHLEEQLAIYVGAEALIVAEGSSQHCLELLGFHPHKQVVVICRREQLVGMDKPLRARFPQVQFVSALQQQWMAKDGVHWNGLALLDWKKVAEALNPLLPEPLTMDDCLALQRAGEDQLLTLSAHVPLKLL